MSSSTSSPTYPYHPYLLVPNLYVPDPAGPEVDLAAQPWMMATVIEDDDLTFGGKPLSAWYEEERRRQSAEICPSNNCASDGSSSSSSSSSSSGASASSRSAGSSEDEEEELRGRPRIRSSHRRGKEHKGTRKQ